MKEIIQGKLNRVLITFIILVGAFLGITSIGYIIEVELLNELSYSYLDYLLYLLGYGSIDDSNIWFKVVFSISSLFVLTLFSSACTVTWLESRRTLKIDDSISIEKDANGDYIANVCLRSKAQSIYGAKVAVIINVESESFSEEAKIAYIPRKSYRYAKFKIGLNSVFYKHFKEILENRQEGTELVVAITYSDVLSGEEYTVFKKYTYANLKKKHPDFVFGTKDKTDTLLKSEFEKYITANHIDINLSNAKIIDSKSPERYSPEPQNAFSVCFEAEKEYNGGDFQMFCIPIDINDDWGVYYDMGAHLYIELDTINDINVFVEIKNDDGRTVNILENTKLNSDNRILEIDMTRYRRHTWENMKEVCFTVFFSHVRDENKKAEFTIKECAFHI